MFLLLILLVSAVALVVTADATIIAGTLPLAHNFPDTVTLLVTTRVLAGVLLAVCVAALTVVPLFLPLLLFLLPLPLLLLLFLHETLLTHVS